MSTLTLDLPAAALPGAALAGKYLTFALGAEFYGISIASIREIIQMPEVTPVPKMPAYVRGVLNLRGRIIPVIDLRRLIELPNDRIDERTCVVVIEAGLPGARPIQMGLVVDDVEEVVNIREEEVEEPPQFGAQLHADYLLGMAKIKGRVKSLLDIDRLLSNAGLEKVSTLAA